MMFRRHRKPAPVLVYRYGVTRGGVVGVAVIRDGKMVGWGGNQTAALASYQMGQAA